MMMKRDGRDGHFFCPLAVVAISVLIASFLSACATTPDPDLSDENHLQLLDGDKLQSTIYVDTAQCASSAVFLRSDFDRASDIMCDGFNSEIQKTAKRLGLKVVTVAKDQFVRGEQQRSDLAPSALPAEPADEYRIVVAHWTYFEQSRTGGRATTGSFGVRAYVYRNQDNVFLQKTRYENSKSGYLSGMAEAGRKTARQLVADLFERKDTTK
jgi:hypothetical protein